MNIVKLGLSSLLLAIVATGALGCSGSDSNDAPPKKTDENPAPATRLDGAKVLSTVSDADVKGLCEDLAKYDSLHVKESDVTVLCVAKGLVASVGADNRLAACKAAAQKCEQTETKSPAKPAPTATLSTGCNAVTSAKFKGCSGVTVAELATCHKDQINAEEAISCETSLADKPGKPDMSPASCAKIEAKCPGVGNPMNH